MRSMEDIDILLDRAILIEKSPSFACVGPGVARPVSDTYSIPQTRPVVARTTILLLKTRRIGFRLALESLGRDAR